MVGKRCIVCCGAEMIFVDDFRAVTNLLSGDKLGFPATTCFLATTCFRQLQVEVRRKANRLLRKTGPLPEMVSLPKCAAHGPTPPYKNFFRLLARNRPCIRGRCRWLSCRRYVCRFAPNIPCRWLCCRQYVRRFAPNISSLSGYEVRGWGWGYPNETGVLAGYTATRCVCGVD